MFRVSFITDFLRDLPPLSHSMLICDDPKRKLWRVFNAVYYALMKDRAVVYLAPRGEVERCRVLLRGFDVRIPGYEDSGQLLIRSSGSFYIDECEGDKERILEAWRGMLEGAAARGFNGLLGVGDNACFFEDGRWEQLVDYEVFLGRELIDGFTGLCVARARFVKPSYYRGMVSAQEGFMEFPRLLCSH